MHIAVKAVLRLNSYSNILSLVTSKQRATDLNRCDLSRIPLFKEYHVELPQA